MKHAARNSRIRNSQNACIPTWFLVRSGGHRRGFLKSCEARVAPAFFTGFAQTFLIRVQQISHMSKITDPLHVTEVSAQERYRCTRRHIVKMFSGRQR